MSKIKMGVLCGCPFLFVFENGGLPLCPKDTFFTTHNYLPLPSL